MKKFKSEGLNGNSWEKKYQSEGLNCIPWKKKFKSEGQDPNFLIKKYGSEGLNAFPGRRDSNPRGKSDGLAQPSKHQCRHFNRKGQAYRLPFRYRCHFAKLWFTAASDGQHSREPKTQTDHLITNVVINAL